MVANAMRGITEGASRRDFFKLSGAAALAAGGAGMLSGCSSDGGDDQGLTHATWNVPASIASLKDLIKDYDGPGKPVSVTSTPADNPTSWLSTRLASDTAPEVMTWTYQTLGRFADKGLIDLSEYLPSDYGQDFLGSYWGGVTMKGGTFAVPLHTNGWGTFMNVDIMNKIGVDVPKGHADAWDWDEFEEIAREVKKATGKYAFSWFLVGSDTASRWLPVLYMHGGAVLNEDQSAPAIDSPEGIEAIEWTRTWFEDGLMSPSNSLKASKAQTAETLFANEQVGMMIASDFKMLAIKDKMPEEKWTVGPLFRDVEEATNLGGNALVVTSTAADPEAAAEYVKYMCSADSMKAFCEASSFVPARKSLVDEGLEWDYRPEAMQMFAQNSKLVPEAMASLETMPQFSEIAALMTDQLELCWTGQQASPDTATAISDGIKRILAK